MNAASALDKIPFFKGWDESALFDVTRRLRRLSYPEGSFIFREGDPGSSLYIVESGYVRITRSNSDGRGVMLALLGAGEFFGELALLDDPPRGADAIAHTPVDLVVLDGEPFREALTRHPVAALNVAIALSRRLRKTSDLLAETAFLDIPGRVASRIAALSRPEGDHFVAEVTQTGLAEILGVSRESVNKAVSRLEATGALTRSGRRITFSDLSELLKRAD